MISSQPREDTELLPPPPLQTGPRRIAFNEFFPGREKETFSLSNCGREKDEMQSCLLLRTAWQHTVTSTHSVPRLPESHREVLVLTGMPRLSASHHVSYMDATERKFSQEAEQGILKYTSPTGNSKQSNF